MSISHQEEGVIMNTAASATVAPIEGQSWNDLHCYACGQAWTVENIDHESCM